MAIAFRAVGALSGADSGTLVGVGLPAGHVANDILVCWTVQHDNVASTVAGYTLIASQTNGAAMTTRIFAKRDGGSEAAPSVTHAAGGQIIAMIAAYSGVDPGLAIATPGAGSVFRDAQSATGTGVGAGTITVTAPALTGVVSGDMRLFIGSRDQADTSGGGITNDWTPPASFTERTDTGRTNVTNSQFELADFLATGSAGGVSATGNAQAFNNPSWIGFQLALSSDASSTGIGPAPAYSWPRSGINLPGYPTLAQPIGPTQGPDPSTFDVVTPLETSRFFNPLSLALGIKLPQWTAPIIPAATSSTWFGVLKDNPFTFNIAVNGVRTRFGSTTTALVFNIATAGVHIAFGRTIGAVLHFDFVVNGTRTRFGSTTTPLTFNIATNGARLTTGSTTTALTFNIATAGKDTKVSSVTTPLTFSIAVRGVAAHFATTATPLVFNIGTAGAIPGTVDAEPQMLQADTERLDREPWPKPPKSPPPGYKPFKPGYMRKKAP